MVIEKLKIRLYDINFAHHAPKSSLSSFPGHDVFCRKIEWVRDPDFKSDITFFTDSCISEVDDCDSRYKIALILEPEKMIPDVYLKIKNIYHKFTCVLTYDEDLLRLDPKIFKHYVFGGAWIKEEDIKIYPKTKNFCIIASHKRQLEGHLLRHEIISKLSKKHGIDVYGSGYRPFDQMADVLKDYRFCIVIENVKKNFWITEKFFTPILSGCIPIYWGTNFNEKLPFSDKRGVYKFNNIDELDALLLTLNETIYNYHLENQDISDNMSKSQKYRVCEDYIFESVFKQMNLF